MDPPLAVADDPRDLLDPILARVVDFLRAARDQATFEHREDQRAEQRQIAVVERTVDEDALVVAGGEPPTALGMRHVAFAENQRAWQICLLGRASGRHPDTGTDHSL